MGFTTPTIFSLMPLFTCFVMYSVSLDMSVQVPCSALYWYFALAGTIENSRFSASS